MFEKPLKIVWVGPKVEWGGVSGNHCGRQLTVSARFMETQKTQIRHQPALPAFLSERKLPLQP